MLETITFAFIFAWFKGYNIKNILKHWSIYPIILTCIFNIYLVYSVIHSNYQILEYSIYIKTVSLLFYFVLIWKYDLMNISIFKTINKNKIFISLTSPVVIGGLLIFIGSKLNQIAMSYNENKMPVFFSNSWATGYAQSNMFIELQKYGDFHVFGDQYTKLIPLTNIFDVGFMSFSVGDILIKTFVFLIIYYSFKNSQ